MKEGGEEMTKDIVDGMAKPIIWPKISIVVPIYNGEVYLKECLMSLMNQTYKRIEIICIDDGSTDDSYKIAQEYVSIDKRIKLVRQENMGVSAARNAGIRFAAGDFIMFCDCDDYFEWTAVESCVKALLSHTGCDAVLFNCIMFSSQGCFTALTGEQYRNVPEQIDCQKTGLLGGFANVCFGMYSLKILRENNLLFREKYIYEDWDFVAHFLSVADKVYWLNVNLYHYRWMKNNTISGRVTFECLQVFDILSFVEKYFRDSGRWENNQYSFYIKALGHIRYFTRDRLINAKEEVKKAFSEKASEFVQSIPYTLLCSLVHFFPMEDRIALLEMHKDHDIALEFCRDNLRRHRRTERINRIKSFLKKILMKILPAYRVAVNTRFEMEQMHGELIGKLNEITWLQYENQRNINLIFHKLGIEGEEKIMEEILFTKKIEDYVK